MLYVILGIAILLLFAAGILAYQNSKLISYGKTIGYSTPSVLHVYTIFDQPLLDEAEDPNSIPLFQITVSGGSDGSTSVTRSGSTYILCKTAASKGEMVLDDVQKWILNLIHHATIHGYMIEHKSFIHNAISHKDKELIMNLEDAVQS